MSDLSEAAVPPRTPGLGDDASDELVVATSRNWVRDWRVWFGIGVTVLCLWLAMRDLPLADVRAAMAGANVWLVALLSVIGHCGATFLRAVRWRYLVEPVAPMSVGLLFRGQALGFMLNNLMPMRIGEFVRAWYVARESGTRASAVLGTVVLERILDVISVLTMATIGLAGLAWLGVEADQDGNLTRAAMAMVPLAAVAVGGLLLLRFAPGFVLSVARWVLKPFPARLVSMVDGLLHGFIEGLGSLRGGIHLLWIALSSAVIWLVFATLPVYAGLVAFDLDLGTTPQVIVTSWVVLAAVGMAVAIPSAPGFFGLYQYVFQLVLAPFGVDGATAFAVGLVVWFFFWIILILQGFVVLRGGPGSLLALIDSPGKAPTTESR